MDDRIQRPGKYRRYSMRVNVPREVFRIIGRIQSSKIKWERLGEDFERVYDANAERLYEN